MLYSHNGTVYVAARSIERANVGIKAIETAHPNAKGILKPLAIDLADLSTVKPAVKRFLSQENQLHVLVHNAGVMTPPAGSKTKTVRLRISKNNNARTRRIIANEAFLSSRAMISKWEQIVLGLSCLANY